jgi:hypothetical protein
MNVDLAVVADYASVSDEKLNILGIFREVRTQRLPVTVPHLYVVVTFQVEPREYGAQWLIRVVLRREDHDGGEILSFEGTAQVPEPLQPKDRVYLNQVLGLTGVTFDRAGEYRFSILVDSDEKASIPLTVHKLE